MGYCIGVALVALMFVAGRWYWRRRQKDSGPMVSFVALLREPFSLDPAVLAATAGRVWKGDFGDGSTPGADGFVIGDGPIKTIFHGNRPYLANALDMPYVNDPEAVSESIVDLRIRQLFSEHRAWLSFDALGVNGKTPADEIFGCYTDPQGKLQGWFTLPPPCGRHCAGRGNRDAC
jgi:hypothetical protein